METINNKTFQHRPMKELMAIVRQDFKKLDDEGLIDEGNLIKVVMYCNDRLGVGVREIKHGCIEVEDYKAKLPANFEKLFYTCALKATNSIAMTMRNPFNNSFDRDIIYEAELDRESFGGTDFYGVRIKREDHITIHNKGEWTSLEINDSTSLGHCHMECPNARQKGKYCVTINDGYIHTPFRCGELYIMYVATMCDEEGNLLFPFHPMITPYYEWSIKEKVIMDAIFNSDMMDASLLQLAQREKTKAWLDAYDMTTSKGFGEYVAMQRKKELGWYHQWFRFFQ